MNNTTLKVRRNGVHTNTHTTQQVQPSLIRLMTQQARQWSAFVLETTGMNTLTVAEKALDAVAFSIESGAKALAIPTKLAGTRDHQEALATLHGLNPIYARRLNVEVNAEGIIVSFTDLVLGRIQDKHARWLRQLIGPGARVYLLAVTGTDSPGKYMGCNVAIGHVAAALDVYRSTVEQNDATTTADEDVELWRDRNGTACANVVHFPRHSEGIEWGYAGSGPSDLARSVLLRFTGPERADRLYQQFKREVIARIPKEGGRIPAAFVVRWLADHDDA